MLTRSCTAGEHLMREIKNQTSPSVPVKIAVVAPIAVRYDAISNAARHTYRILRQHPGLDVSFITTHNEAHEIPAIIVSGLVELLRCPAYRSADVIIYGFGIYNELIESLSIGNGHAKQIVRFHNITPQELVGDNDKPLIAASFRQLHNLKHADHIWADSRTNANILIEHGIDPMRIEVAPLLVEHPTRARLLGKPSAKLNLLYVGRGVPAKGLLDGLTAYGRALEGGAGPAHLSIICNINFSDQAYLDKCRRAIEQMGLQSSVSFCGTVDDDALQRLYHDAHVLLIPTFHEGFSVPVVEALRAGCIPVGYAAGNMSDIVAGLGCLVPTGDKAALGDALTKLMLGLRAGLRSPAASKLPLDRGMTSVVDLDDLALSYTERFAEQRVSRQMIEGIRKLIFTDARALQQRLNIRPEFTVVPDNEMRERVRTSLNRLPDPSDWLPGDRLTDLMREMSQPICIHRKSWEYAICIKGLTDLKIINPETVGLAVGAGSESPLYWFANNIRRMVATDLYDNPAHEGTPAMLANPKAFAPFAYREDHLEVYRMGGDALAFSDGTFDFVFCLSSIEHFGSRAIQRKSLDEMARVLRPGGVACVITELILTDHSDKEYFRWEELDEMFLKHPHFELVGGAPDLSISASQVAYPVDLTNSKFINRSPHIMLKRGEMLWTSFSMFLKRKETKVDGRKVFSRVESLAELNVVNDAQKSVFNAMVEASSGELMKQREDAYLNRWKEALVYIKEGAPVLDIGGGWPIKIVWDVVLKEHGIDYHFLDIDEGIVAMARQWLPSYERPATNAVVGTNVVLPFSDGQFDVVFSSHCIEHSPNLARTFGEIHRVLAPEGIFIFAVPFGFDDSDEHLLCLDVEDWIDAAEMAGFEVINYHIGQTYPMSGWDLFAVTRRRTTGINIVGLQTLAARRSKMQKALFLAHEPIFSFSGQTVESGPHRVVVGKGGQIIATKCGLDALLFLRQPSSAVVEITDGVRSKIIDLSTRISFVAAVDVRDFEGNITTKILGHGRGHGEVVVLYGALCAVS